VATPPPSPILSCGQLGLERELQAPQKRPDSLLLSEPSFLVLKWPWSPPFFSPSTLPSKNSSFSWFLPVGAGGRANKQWGEGRRVFCRRFWPPRSCSTPSPPPPPLRPPTPQVSVFLSWASGSPSPFSADLCRVAEIAGRIVSTTASALAKRLWSLKSAATNTGKHHGPLPAGSVSGSCFRSASPHRVWFSWRRQVRRRRGGPWCGTRAGTRWTRYSTEASWGSSRMPWRSAPPASCSCSTPSTVTSTGSSCRCPDVSTLCFQPPRVLSLSVLGSLRRILLSIN
jgi:hypothetical protein